VCVRSVKGAVLQEPGAALLHVRYLPCE
jgi:hypothetical protein